MPLIWADFFVFRLNYQMHIFHSLAVLRAGGDDINSCCVNAAVTENIGKLGDVLFDSIEHTGEQVLFQRVIGPGEQVAQVMRKHLFRIDIRLHA